MVGAFTNVSDDRRRAPAGRKIALHRYRSGRHAIDRVYQKQCGTLLLNSLLVLFVLTLRDLGSTRTSAYFSTAPFMGAAIAILAVGDHASPTFWMAAVLWARAYGST